MTTLFEYGAWTKTQRPAELRNVLRDLWAEPLFVPDTEDLPSSSEDKRYQPFLSFDGDSVRANNFVGFIQNDDELIEIYPKVFRGVDGAEDQKELMHRHIFYWFGYCRKWRFPFSQASLDTREIDRFPELIIHQIANTFLDAVSLQPLSLYQPISDVLQSPRGSINFKSYLNGGLAHGMPHKIDCDHEPFLFDNRVNRLIKYCSRLLSRNEGRR